MSRRRTNLIEPFKQLGEVTARTHIHSMGWKRPPYFERLCWDFEHSLGEHAELGHLGRRPRLHAARRPLLQRLVDRWSGA